MTSFCRNPIAADFLLTMSSVSWLRDIQLSSRTLHQQTGLKVLDKRTDSKVLSINTAIKI